MVSRREQSTPDRPGILSPTPLNHQLPTQHQHQRETSEGLNIWSFQGNLHGVCCSSSRANTKAMPGTGSGDAEPASFQSQTALLSRKPSSQPLPTPGTSYGSIHPKVLAIFQARYNYTLPTTVISCKASHYGSLLLPPNHPCHLKEKAAVFLQGLGHMPVLVNLIPRIRTRVFLGDWAVGLLHVAEVTGSNPLGLFR